MEGPRHIVINKRYYTQSDAEGCLSREARQKPKERKKNFKDPSLFKASPTSKLIIIKIKEKRLRGGGGRERGGGGGGGEEGDT